MGTVDEVTAILRETYGWTTFCAPAPNATALQLKVDSPETVAGKLDTFILNVRAAGLPWGVPPEKGYDWACYAYFQIGKEYYELNTAIALGQQVEAPVDTIGAANSPTEWLDHQEHLRNRLGEKLCDQAEFDRRKSFANLVPLEWLGWPGGGLIYQLAVREGYLPVGMVRFDPAYLTSQPKLDEVRGMDALMWLQNLQARDKGMPVPWLPGGTRNPAVPQ